jgi:hypothetical protein
MAERFSLLHASLLVADLARARAFYEGVLGLVPSPARPAMSFDGVWYDLGRGQIHLINLPNPDPVAGRPEHGGRTGTRPWACRTGERSRPGWMRRRCPTASAGPGAGPCSSGIRTATRWN